MGAAQMRTTRRAIVQYDARVGTRSAGGLSGKRAILCMNLCMNLANVSVKHLLINKICET